MIATVDTRDLAAALKTTAAAISTRPNMPILAAVLLQPSDRGVTLTTFDLETSVVVDVAATADGTTEPVGVAHRLLSQIVAVAGAKQLKLHLDHREPTVRVVAGRSEWRLPRMIEQDYPKLPAMPAPCGTVAADVLAAAIRTAALAASRDETLPMLTGVRMEFTADEITCAATDRYRLHLSEVPWKADGALPDPVLIPARALRTLTSVEVGDVELSVTDTLFAARIGHTQFTTRLMHETFPAYRRLLKPRDQATTVVTVGTAALMLAVRQVEAGGGDQVQMQITAEQVRILGRDLTNHVDTGETEVDATAVGDDVTVGINPDFLNDGLSAVPGDVVELQIGNPTKPIMLAEPNQPGHVMVMPIRLPG